MGMLKSVHGLASDFGALSLAQAGHSSIEVSSATSAQSRTKGGLSASPNLSCRCPGRTALVLCTTIYIRSRAFAGGAGRGGPVTDKAHDLLQQQEIPPQRLS